MGWETRLGVWATVTAVAVAVVTLVASSRALIRERRADFHLEQLARIAVIVQGLNENGAPELSARTRMLPADQFPMPVIRAWGEVSQATSERSNEIHETWRARGAPQKRSELGPWLRAQGQAEVDRAVEHVLEVRRGRWEWACRQFGFRGGVER